MFVAFEVWLVTFYDVALLADDALLAVWLLGVAFVVTFDVVLELVVDDPFADTFPDDEF